jgi:hypothetical protein
LIPLRVEHISQALGYHAILRIGDGGDISGFYRVDEAESVLDWSGVPTSDITLQGMGVHVLGASGGSEGFSHYPAREVSGGELLTSEETPESGDGVYSNMAHALQQGIMAHFQGRIGGSRYGVGKLISGEFLPHGLGFELLVGEGLPLIEHLCYVELLKHLRLGGSHSWATSGNEVSGFSSAIGYIEALPHEFGVVGFDTAGEGF